MIVLGCLNVDNLLLKKFLSDIHKVNDKILDEYISYWTEYSIPKKTIITECGRTERYLYFVKDGIQKSYYLNEGKQHVMFFAYAPSFSGIVESFFTQTPSKYYLETITDSTFLRIPYSKHAQLIKEHRELETLFRIITEQFLIGIIERLHQLMAYNTETRFKKFVKRSPHLINMLSQKDIASYLRIDPTNYSKLINTVKI
ncbi:cAMP-binding protein [Polaribacter sp. Hel1_85]|nr:cAMP-binding protein [Polaribacter sp. Hel1_85]